MNEKKKYVLKKNFAEICEEYHLNDDQIEFLHNFSMKQSMRAYEKVAKQVANESATIDEDWVYKGYYDAGYRCADHCSGGHALRFVHIAKNKKTGDEVKFGIHCASEFFNITPFQLKCIQKGYHEASTLINSTIKMLEEYGSFKEYDKQTEISKKLKAVIDEDASLLMNPYNDEFEEMMKVSYIRQMVEKLELPLPDVYHWTVRRAYDKLQAMKEDKQVSDLSKELDEKIMYTRGFSNLKHISKVMEKLNNSIERGKISDKQMSFAEHLNSIDWKGINERFRNFDISGKTFANDADKSAYANLKYVFKMYGLNDEQVAKLDDIIVAAQ